MQKTLKTTNYGTLVDDEYACLSYGASAGLSWGLYKKGTANSAIGIENAVSKSTAFINTNNSSGRFATWGYNSSHSNRVIGIILVGVDIP